MIVLHIKFVGRHDLDIQKQNNQILHSEA